MVPAWRDYGMGLGSRGWCVVVAREIVFECGSQVGVARLLMSVVQSSPRHGEVARSTGPAPTACRSKRESLGHFLLIG